MKYLLAGEQSDRLLFRKVVSSDYDTWLPFHKEPLSSLYWNGLPSDPRIACQQQFDAIFERYANGLGGMNALTSKETNRLIGLCGLLVQTVDGTVALEIAYSILPEFWSNGYATEAAQKCKEVAFKNEWTTHLISIIHIDNLPSQNVAIKNGMERYQTTTYKNTPVHIYRINS
jgi:ribosomal-protein-alanine N-acetyltransferase